MNIVLFMPQFSYKNNVGIRCIIRCNQEDFSLFYSPDAPKCTCSDCMFFLYLFFFSLVVCECICIFRDKIYTFVIMPLFKSIHCYIPHAYTYICYSCYILWHTKHYVMIKNTKNFPMYPLYNV